MDIKELTIIFNVLITCFNAVMGVVNYRLGKQRTKGE